MNTTDDYPKPGLDSTSASKEVPDLNSCSEPETLADYFAEYRAKLERMIDFRLDPRLRNRVDPADILQEAFLVAQRRHEEFEASRGTTPYVWLRQITLQVLIDYHRAQFRQKRSVGQEVRLDRRAGDGQATSLLIAHEIAGKVSTPSRLVSREEDLEQLRQALATMDELDQEVLALRHFEHLSNNEVAEILGIGITAASNRYVRAMSRLAQVMNTGS